MLRARSAMQEKKIQTCNVTRVQSATEWTASVHTLHMSKPVM